jgi:hypothetical protein
VSYDFLLFRLVGKPSVAELSEETTAPLGTVEEIERAISACFSSVVWEGGRCSHLGGAMRFSLSDKRPIRCVFVHTSYRADCKGALIQLCATTGWVAFDIQTGNFLEPAP